MGKYFKSLFISFIISLFLLIDNASALTFDSISVRTAYFYENGTLSDSGFVNTNPRNLPQYISTTTGAVSMRLFQWRYSTSSPLEKGRYKITTDITFSSLQGNDIVNFLNPTFDEFGCGTNQNDSSPSNCILVDYNTKEINNTKFQFNYTIDLLNDNCNFFSGVFKYYDQEYNNFTIVNLYGTENATLSYSTSFQKLSSQNNDDIIDNANQNTQDIIDNQNQNTQDIIDSNKVCSSYDKTSIIDDNVFLYSNGVKVSSENYGITDYINVNNATISTLVEYGTSTTAYSCFYNVNKTLISCFNNQNTGEVIVPNDAHYVRFSIQKVLNKPQFKVCKNGSQSVSDGLNDLTGSITDDNVDSDIGTGFFDDFNNEDFGLSDIITIPLNTINSLTSKSCQPLSIPIPKTGKNINLPCMTQVYEDNIGSIFSIWQIVSFGLIAYFISIDIFHLVKGFKDPESDKVEVLDL